MRCIGYMQVGLLAILAIEGGTLLMRLAVNAPANAGPDCRYDYIVLAVTEEAYGTSADELLKKHAATQMAAKDIFAKSGVAFKITNEDSSLTPDLEFHDEKPDVGLIDRIVGAVSESPMPLHLYSNVQYRLPSADKAAELMRQLAQKQITSELRFQKGDSCEAEATARQPLTKNP